MINYRNRKLVQVLKIHKQNHNINKLSKHRIKKKSLFDKKLKAKREKNTNITNDMRIHNKNLGHSHLDKSKATK